MNSTIKRIIEHGIDGISDIISWNEDNADFRIETPDLHDQLYNQDYFVIGTHEATQILADYGTFNAINEIKEWEQDHFGSVDTDLSDPEKVLNMLAYIIGEDKLMDAENGVGDEESVEFNINDLKEIRIHLENELEEVE